MKKLARHEQCTHCGRFANRGVSVDGIIIRGDEILLVKRGGEPYKGFWAIPGGYVEWDEPAEEAVRREVKEETGLDVKSHRLVGIYSDPGRHPKQTIGIVYLVEAEGEPGAGDDADEVKWFALNDLPEQLGFDHKQLISDARKLVG